MNTHLHVTSAVTLHPSPKNKSIWKESGNFDSYFVGERNNEIPWTNTISKNQSLSKESLGTSMYRMKLQYDKTQVMRIKTNSSRDASY